MPVKNLMVRAGADFSAITKQAKKASASMAGMKNSVTASCGKMTKAVNGMKKVMGAIGVAASVTALAAYSKSAKEAYETQIEGETKLATVMRQRMAATDDQIKSILELTSAQQALGVIGDEVQLSGAQQLSTYLKQTDSLKTLIPAMNNLLAQQKGLNAAETDAVAVGNMMGKAMQGQASALRRVGITFSAAEEEVLKYGNETQRAAMLAQIITNNVGNMNQALAATPSGRLKQVSNTLGDIKEQFGGAVTSVLTTFLPAMNAVASVLASIATLANKVAQAIANVFGKGASNASTAVSYTAAAAGSMDDLAEATSGAGKAAKSLSTYGFDTLQKLSGTTGSGGSDGGADENVNIGGGGGISTSVEGADEAGESIGWLERGLQRLKATAASINLNNLTASFDRLKQAVAPLTQGLFAGLSWAYDNVLDPLAHWTMESALPAALDVLASAAGVLSSALSALQPLASWLWNSFLQPLAKWAGNGIITLLQTLAAKLNGISDWIKEHQKLVETMVIVLGSLATAFGVVSAAVNALSGIMLITNGSIGAVSAAFGFLTSHITIIIAAIAALVAGIVILVRNWDTVKTTAISVWEGIKTAWGTACEWFTSVVINPIKTRFDTVVTAIRTVFTGAWDAVKSVWSTASDWFKTTVISPLTDGFRGFVNGIIGFFEGMANGAISGINVLIDALNNLSFTAPDWVPEIGGKTMGFHLTRMAPVSIPRLADGAVLRGNDPYLAVVNDQKSGVNVETPLATMIEAMMTALRSTDFNSDIVANVKVVFEGQLAALARILRPYIEADAQRVGGKASVAKGVV